MQLRLMLFFSFIVLAVYCYGAGMMDYFAVYEAWKLIDAEDFAAYHQFQGSRIIPIFVIPSGVMTLFNIASAIFPPAFVDRRWLWAAVLAYSFDWIFSFTMQIPIQLVLETRKDMALIDELLKTNWWRFAADSIHIVIVLVIIGNLLKALQRNASAIAR